jgi:hypothetical protein
MRTGPGVAGGTKALKWDEATQRGAARCGAAASPTAGSAPGRTINHGETAGAGCVALGARGFYSSRLMANAVMASVPRSPQCRHTPAHRLDLHVAEAQPGGARASGACPCGTETFQGWGAAGAPTARSRRCEACSRGAGVRHGGARRAGACWCERAGWPGQRLAGARWRRRGGGAGAVREGGLWRTWRGGETEGGGLKSRTRGARARGRACEHDERAS